MYIQLMKGLPLIQIQQKIGYSVIPNTSGCDLPYDLQKLSKFGFN